MANFIDVNVKNPATGSTEFNTSNSNETESKIQKLLSKMGDDLPINEETSLSKLNEVIGEPAEMDIEISKLIIPPDDWTNIFKKADENDIQKMAASIYKFGLLHRITAWQTDLDKYTILGGMTRTAAFKYLYELTSDKNGSQFRLKFIEKISLIKLMPKEFLSSAIQTNVRCQQKILRWRIII